MLGLIRKGGSPVWVGATDRDDGEVKDRGHFLHHPKHAIATKNRCDELGIEAVLDRDAQSPDNDMPGFLFKHLGVAPGAR